MSDNRHEDNTGFKKFTERCGECDNCIALKKIQHSVLRCCNPPFSHADQDTVDLWNKELKRLPCNPDGMFCDECLENRKDPFCK